MPFRPLPFTLSLIAAAAVATPGLASPGPQESPISQLATQTEIARSGTVLVAPPTSASCPVGLSSRRQANAVLSFTRDGSPAPAAVLYRVDFQPHGTPALVSVTLTAQGPARTTLAVPVAADLSSSFEVAHLDLAADGNALQHGKLRLHTLAGAAWLEVSRIRYTNGTVWQASPGSRCIAVPDGLLLVR